jgi:hypothetical protein
MNVLADEYFVAKSYFQAERTLRLRLQRKAIGYFASHPFAFCLFSALCSRVVSYRSQRSAGRYKFDILSMALSSNELILPSFL